MYRDIFDEHKSMNFALCQISYIEQEFVMKLEIVMMFERLKR